MLKVLHRMMMAPDLRMKQGKSSLIAYQEYRWDKGGWIKIDFSQNFKFRLI